MKEEGVLPRPKSNNEYVFLKNGHCKEQACLGIPESSASGWKS